MTDKQRRELKSMVKKVFLADYSNNYIKYSEFSGRLQKFCIEHNFYSTIKNGSWKNELMIFDICRGDKKETFIYNILKEKRKLKIKSLYD